MAEAAQRRGADRVVVIAGGGGTRLWPWTGPDLPKPLLPLGGGGRTLLEATLHRLAGVALPGALSVLAPEHLVRLFSAAAPELAREQFWSEPAPRDTGPAIAFAMRRIVAEDPAAVVVVSPADHRVTDETRFQQALADAADAARAGWLVVLGVAPDRPATRFGYVELGPPLGRGPAGVRQVARFVEKPAPGAAQELVARGALWNAGLFVWRADAFWSALETCAPDIAAPVAATVDHADVAAWGRARRTSIDYALMERAERIAVAPLAAGWDDVGGWESVIPLAAQGDAGPLVQLEVRGDAPAQSIVLRVGPQADETGVVLGDEPLVVVVGPRGVLVAPRAAADRVKHFV